MIVVMKPDATALQIEHMANHITSLGSEAPGDPRNPPDGHRRAGGGRPGSDRGPRAGRRGRKGLADHGSVQACLVGAEARADRGQGTRAGGRRDAGRGDRRARARSRARSRSSRLARQLKALGATGLRGGAYKPRTSPYSFQGHKELGLKMLATARAETGLAIVTEVMAPEHVAVVSEYADVLQIGARNMQNYQLLQAVGDSGKPALLKRGMSATLEEFLLAAEYILDRGNPNVMLCERGIRTYEDHTRFTLPLATVPYLHDKSHLPVVVDPSHGTGKSRLVVPMARASIAAGADGLIIEVHDDPEHAVSDGAQTITPAAFKQLMDQCRRIAEAVDRTM